MKKQFGLYLSFLTLSLLVLSACGKKVAKTTGSADSDSASRVNGGLSTPTSSSSSSSFNWGSSSSSSSSSAVSSSSSSSSSSIASSSSYCSSISGLGVSTRGSVEELAMETVIAKFFFKTVVPQSERGSSAAALAARMANYTYTDSNGYHTTAVMRLQGNVTYCLTPSGSGSTRAFALKIEYEDAFGLSSITIPSSKTYYALSSSSEINIIWMDQAGFVQILGSKSGAKLKFANMPSTTALNARSDTDRDLVPLATLRGDRDYYRSGSSSLDQAVGEMVYPPDMFLDANTWSNSTFNIGSFPYEGTFTSSQKYRLIDMMGRYVDSEIVNSTTHPFNSYPSRYLIQNGKLGTVSVPTSY